jgi:arginine decarboxylase
MQLYVASSIGRGRTELGAFDAALAGAGAHNFNLIRLSSVVPPESEVTRVPKLPPECLGEWGDRLYVVYAEQRTSTPGTQAWAGVGWVQDPVTRRGLFVEHEGDSEDAVRNLIEGSLTDLQATRNLDLGPAQTCVIGGTCAGSPLCALVVVAFGAEPWSGIGSAVAAHPGLE